MSERGERCQGKGKWLRERKDTLGSMNAVTDIWRLSEVVTILRDEFSFFFFKVLVSKL